MLEFSGYRAREREKTYIVPLGIPKVHLKKHHMFDFVAEKEINISSLEKYYLGIPNTIFHRHDRMPWIQAEPLGIPKLHLTNDYSFLILWLRERGIFLLLENAA